MREVGAGCGSEPVVDVGEPYVLDAKLTDISSRLHPMIAASMIKDGLNPLDMDIDDTLEYIKSFGVP